MDRFFTFLLHKHFINRFFSKTKIRRSKRHHKCSPRGGFINVKDLYNNDVGKGGV